VTISICAVSPLSSINISVGVTTVIQILSPHRGGPQNRVQSPTTPQIHYNTDSHPLAPCVSPEVAVLPHLKTKLLFFQDAYFYHYAHVCILLMIHVKFLFSKLNVQRADRQDPPAGRVPLVHIRPVIG
jgi:hypothetical protein